MRESEAMLLIAKEVVVAFTKSEFPPKVVEASVAPPTALKAPVMVEDPVTAKLVVVAFPVMTRSLGKVYVPEPPKVPGVVVMIPVEPE